MTTIATKLPSLPYIFTSPYAPVAKWLLATSGAVATIVHVGGVTRLTKSGLSMTDWKPLGSLPPMNKREWQEEFERYKAFPEWEQRRSMDLDEFKFIYFWEWGHRMLGRTVGILFTFPAIYFLAKNKIPPTGSYKPRLALLLSLGALQGGIGWWMVQSGLHENRRGDRQEIRVSPYRLATHLGMAITTFGVLTWTGMDLLQRPNARRMVKYVQTLSHQQIQFLTKLRGMSFGVLGLTFLTMISGAFVAGNDAGRAYNTFPKMGDDWIPPDIIDASLRPKYRNLFENTAAVQLTHRVLGSITALSAVSISAVGLFHPVSRSVSTVQIRHGLVGLGLVGGAQASLGVMTLIHYVPLGLAAVHQLGSLVLFSSGLFLVHSLRFGAGRVARRVLIMKK